VNCFRNFFGANGEAINKLQISLRGGSSTCASSALVAAVASFFGRLSRAAAIDRGYTGVSAAQSSVGIETQAIPA
jgi:hypothetical protein